MHLWALGRPGAVSDKPPQEGGRRGLRRVGGTGGWGSVSRRFRNIRGCAGFDGPGWSDRDRGGGGEPSVMDAAGELVDEPADAALGWLGRSLYVL